MHLSNLNCITNEHKMLCAIIMTAIYVIFFASALLIHLFRFNSHEALYLCKNNSNVLKYSDDIEELEELQYEIVRQNYEKVTGQISLPEDVQDKEIAIIHMYDELIKNSNENKDLYLIGKIYQFLKDFDNYNSNLVGPYEKLDLSSGVKLYSCNVRKVSNFYTRRRKKKIVL